MRWKGLEAEWIVLVCRHAGVFSKSPFRARPLSSSGSPFLSLADDDPPR